METMLINLVYDCCMVKTGLELYIVSMYSKFDCALDLPPLQFLICFKNHINSICFQLLIIVDAIMRKYSTCINTSHMLHTLFNGWFEKCGKTWMLRLLLCSARSSSDKLYSLCMQHVLSLYKRFHVHECFVNA